MSPTTIISTTIKHTACMAILSWSSIVHYTIFPWLKGVTLTVLQTTTGEACGRMQHHHIYFSFLYPRYKSGEIIALHFTVLYHKANTGSLHSKGLNCVTLRYWRVWLECWLRLDYILGPKWTSSFRVLQHIMCEYLSVFLRNSVHSLKSRTVQSIISLI